MSKDGMWRGLPKMKNGKKVLYDNPIRGHGSDDEVEKKPRKPRKQKGKNMAAANNLHDSFDASKSFDLQEVPENAELPDQAQPEDFVGLPSAVQEVESKTAAKRKKYFKEQKEKKKRKKNQEDNQDKPQKKTFGKLKDTVLFGEQVAAPPKFSTTPKSREAKMAAKLNTPSIPKADGAAPPSAIEAIRQHVIAQYRALKKNSAYRPPTQLDLLFPKLPSAGPPFTMKQYRSKINIGTQEFKDNHAQLLALTEELHDRLKQAQNQGSPEFIDRYLRAGKILARERVELLLDQDSPFLEICPLAGWGQEKMTLGGSVVAGIGIVSGVECMVTASIPTLKGGSVNKVSLMKGARIAEIARQCGLPTINLNQSAGADLSQQEKVFHKGGASFRELARRSKAGLPSVCVVFGNCTAGGAYSAGMSDYCIMVKNEAKVFLGGPPLVKMATGEVVDDETLGGAEMHSKISGLADYLAQNEYDALEKACEVVALLNWQKKTPLPREHFLRVEEPLYSPEELLGVVGANTRVPFDAREVIARLVDGSRMHEFKPLFGSTLITCWARVHGTQVGFMANNGVLFSDASQKGTQFILMCNQKRVPLIYLQNITGFMVGREAEQAGIIKHGSQLINAVSNSTVPAITIVIGASYGAGNYAMCGRAYEPRFLFSWPNSKCAVMGAEQLTGVMDIVMRDAAEKAGRKVDEEMANQRKAMFQKMVEDKADVYYTSSRMIDDGIIDPRDTRNVLGFCLSISYNSKWAEPHVTGISRM